MRCALNLPPPSSFLLAVTFFGLPLTVRAKTPQAISVDFGSDYFGYDGAWSAAQIRVGSPEQYLSVFPSTTSSETQVAGPSLCDGTSTCASLRGGLFYTKNSTTWQSLGEYQLGYSDLSQTTENGDYGFDNISISDTVSTSKQIIAVVDTLDHWIGNLGLGVKETRFTNDTNYLAFISTLVQNNSAIPSHSYGYTAGASYHGRGVAGSLTLGGIDQLRLASNNFWFDLAAGYIPSAFLRSMEVSASSMPSNWAANPLPLMTQTDTAAFTIDSSTPYLWMPESVCDTIARALNLTWNPTIELYVFNSSSSPQMLSNWGLQFTFRLSNDATSANQIGLPVSYAAFNLQLSYPFPGLFTSYNQSKVNYFPLRRANSTQQYTIGRAFLQEVYLIVDYERNAFQLSPALFPDSGNTKLADITRPKDSKWPGPGGSTSSAGLSTGAKVGIVIGIVIIAAVLTIAVWFFCRRRRRSHEPLDDSKSQRTGLLSIFSKRSTHKSSDSASATELQADKRHPAEMITDSSTSRYELSAIAPVEMAAGEVPPNFFQERNNAAIAQRNDPRSPIELVQPESRNSISKDGVEENVRSTSPAPAYTPRDTATRSSHGVSPHSPGNVSNGFQSGSDGGVSSVTSPNSHRDRLSHANHARSGSDSSRFLSPVSPFPPRSDGHESSYSSTQSGNVRPPSTGARPSNLAPDRPEPRRSPSRDSRFREELQSEQPAPGTSGQDSERNPLIQGDAGTPRFSWER